MFACNLQLESKHRMNEIQYIALFRIKSWLQTKSLFSHNIKKENSQRNPQWFLEIFS